MKTTKVLETNITETNIDEVSEILNFSHLIILQFQLNCPALLSSHFVPV